MKKDKKYQRLSRAELLELLIAESEKSVALELQLREAQKKLDDRELKLNESGSIAEAALALNEVFVTVESACSQYIENIERLSRNQEQVCAEREAESKRIAAQIIAEAQEQANKIEADVQRRCESIVELTNGDITRFRESISNMMT